MDDGLRTFLLNAISEHARRLCALELLSKNPGIKIELPEVRADIRRASAEHLRDRTRELIARAFSGSLELQIVEDFFQRESKPLPSGGSTTPDGPLPENVVWLFPQPDGDVDG